MFASGARTIVIWMLIVIGAVLLIGTAHASSITYDVLFTDYVSGSTLQWFATKGFEPKRDATNGNKVVLSHADKALVLQTKKQAAGLLLSELNIHAYSKIR